MQLSKRLLAIAAMIREQGVLADVGTDHGYLPIYMVQQGQIKRAIALDVNAGPLMRAKAHVEERGLSSYIETRLSDGVAALQADEADILVIAGMGGPLTEKILTEGRCVAAGMKEMILQPQSDIPHVRHFLQDEGYGIQEENMVEEDGKYYPMMRVTHEPVLWEREVYYRYGKELLCKRHPVLFQYLKKEREGLEILKKQLKERQTQGARRRLPLLEEEIRYNQEALEYYEM